MSIEVIGVGHHQSRAASKRVEDKSREKSWSIELDDQGHTVQFGRIGTTGQTQPQGVPHRGRGETSHDKLIAEKLKKGYTEGLRHHHGRLRPARSPLPKPPRRPTPRPSRHPRPRRQPPRRSPPRSIDLDPEDWLWATWRPRTPSPRPEAKPFDLEECLDRFSKATRRPPKLELELEQGPDRPDHVPREEAHFWLVAITEVMRRDLQPGFFVQELRDRECLRWNHLARRGSPD